MTHVCEASYYNIPRRSHVQAAAKSVVESELVTISFLLPVFSLHFSPLNVAIVHHLLSPVTHLELVKATAHINVDRTRSSSSHMKSTKTTSPTSSTKSSRLSHLLPEV